jgi:hypothetical protein
MVTCPWCHSTGRVNATHASSEGFSWVLTLPCPHCPTGDAHWRLDAETKADQADLSLRNHMLRKRVFHAIGPLQTAR